jgi:hypothetical protein
MFKVRRSRREGQMPRNIQKFLPLARSASRVGYGLTGVSISRSGGICRMPGSITTTV